MIPARSRSRCACEGTAPGTSTDPLALLSVHCSSERSKMAACTAETATRQRPSARLEENIVVDQHGQPGLRGEGPSSSSSASFAVVTKAEDNLRARHPSDLCTSPSGYRGFAEHEGARQVTAAREVEQCSRYVAATVKRVRADHAGIPARAFPLFVPRACLRSPSMMQHR